VENVKNVSISVNISTNNNLRVRFSHMGKVKTNLTQFALAGMLLVLAGGCATRLEVQGHRGARGYLPENTLAAFASALDAGVDVLELDTGVTKDGVVVIGHDPCLNVDLARRNGKWLSELIESKDKKGPCITNLSFAELNEFDVGRIRPGSDYAKRFPLQQARDGTMMPTLSALFAMVKARGNDKVRFNIETKLSPFARDETLAPEALVDAVLGVIAQEKMLTRVSIESFDWRTLKIVQQKYPGVPTVYLSAQQKNFNTINAEGREGSAWTAGINAQEHGGSVARMVVAAGGRIWSPHFGDVDKIKVADAQGLGLKVIVWTVNEPKDIEKVLDFGVDGVISDYPDRVMAALKKRGLR
jgi:glycerophosphoryl diester phosphodiesterase